ncbi:hypothetical protein EDB19DRAFT_92842 [Suillus lakei]|nr:hypothetical protein EDB19DRAFT_92842 [Suillus lakei]
MQRTAWSKAAGPVPSDRLRSVQRLQHVPQKQNKTKGKVQEPSKSKAIRKLESLAEGVRKSSGREKDPKGGCFCQAREHDLSVYTPICRGCGLILCAINLPYYACPHCSAAILSDIARSSLYSRLDEEVSKQIAKEEEERSRVVLQARDAEGAFPVLPGSTTPPVPSTSSRPAAQTHKILSLNSKTKKYTVSSYTNTPVSSRPASRAESEVEEVHRVPAPSPEVDFVKRMPDRNHPWSNMRYCQAPC